MEIEIEVVRTEERKELVRIETPYYFMFDRSFETVSSQTFCKLEESKCTSIRTTFDYLNGSNSFEISVDELPISRYAVYFSESYKSTEEEFEEVKSQLLKMVD